MALVPHLPTSVTTDPFTGGLRRYRPQNNGIGLHSVDQDGHDEGAKQEPMDAKSGDKPTYDHTFNLGR